MSASLKSLVKRCDLCHLWWGLHRPAYVDGVTDDTCAIQRAIDSLPPGGTLDLGSGNYLITRTLTLGSGPKS